MRHITKRPTTTRPVRLLASLAAVGALALASCGGGSDDTSTATTASGDASSSEASSSPFGSGGPTNVDLTSRLTNDPLNSTQVTEGGFNVLAASFCDSQVGDGVEILVSGFSSGDTIDAEVNGQSTQLVPTEPDLLQQILTTSAGSYTVEVFLPDGNDVAFELAGCD